MGLKNSVKKLFVPERTQQEKIILKMTKQRYMCQAFYLAMALALIVAFVKVLAKHPFSSYVWEEVIFFVPLLYFAIRHSATNLNNIKKVKVEGAASVLVFFSAIVAVLAAVISLAAMLVNAVISGDVFDFAGLMILCTATGAVTGTAVYFIMHLILKPKPAANNSKPEVETAKGSLSSDA